MMTAISPHDCPFCSYGVARLSLDPVTRQRMEAECGNLRYIEGVIIAMKLKAQSTSDRASGFSDGTYAGIRQARQERAREEILERQPHLRKPPATPWLVAESRAEQCRQRMRVALGLDDPTPDFEVWEERPSW